MINSNQSSLSLSLSLSVRSSCSSLYETLNTNTNFLRFNPLEILAPRHYVGGLFFRTKPRQFSEVHPVKSAEGGAAEPLFNGVNPEDKPGFFYFKQHLHLRGASGWFRERK